MTKINFIIFVKLRICISRFFHENSPNAWTIYCIWELFYLCATFIYTLRILNCIRVQSFLYQRLEPFLFTFGSNYYICSFYIPRVEKRDRLRTSRYLKIYQYFCPARNDESRLYFILVSLFYDLQNCQILHAAKTGPFHCVDWW